VRQLLRQQLAGAGRQGAITAERRLCSHQAAAGCAREPCTSQAHHACESAMNLSVQHTTAGMRQRRRSSCHRPCCMPRLCAPLRRVPAATDVSRTCLHSSGRADVSWDSKLDSSRSSSAASMNQTAPALPQHPAHSRALELSPPHTTT
jgi:hypothetical protein